MECIRCGHDSTSVANSRSTKQSQQVWRRRKCPACKRTFTTYEAINPNYLIIIKGDKNEKYDRSKLFSSIYRALTDNPLDSYHLTETIENKLIKDGGKELESKRIFEIASETLKAFSRSAYLRYISFYPNYISDIEKV